MSKHPHFKAVQSPNSRWLLPKTVRHGLLIAVFFMIISITLTLRVSCVCASVEIVTKHVSGIRNAT